ncbi:MAG: hypothetical protein PUC98_05660, partial [Clostridiales bacterium]|nr:hypothetical protein [Clostridiales bacterium]
FRLLFYYSKCVCFESFNDALCQSRTYPLNCASRKICLNGIGALWRNDLKRSYGKLFSVSRM